MELQSRQPGERVPSPPGQPVLHIAPTVGAWSAVFPAAVRSVSGAALSGGVQDAAALLGAGIAACPGDMSDAPTGSIDKKKKVRKQYTITKQRERWTEEEHQRFLDALKLYGRAWRRIEEHIGTKTAVQIRSHAQKFFSKLEREQAAGNSVEGLPENITIPPPRPKRKPSQPYPRKDDGTSAGRSNSHASNPSAFYLTANKDGEITDATVAAVAAAASAAAAAAAAAVVAAAGEHVQQQLQASPPQGFPFFGLPPSVLATMAARPQSLAAFQAMQLTNAAMAGKHKQELLTHHGKQPKMEATGTVQTGSTEKIASKAAPSNDCDSSACSRENDARNTTGTDKQQANADVTSSLHLMGSMNGGALGGLPGWPSAAAANLWSNQQAAEQAAMALLRWNGITTSVLQQATAASASGSEHQNAHDAAAAAAAVAAASYWGLSGLPQYFPRQQQQQQQPPVQQWRERPSMQAAHVNDGTQQAGSHSHGSGVIAADAKSGDEAEGAKKDVLVEENSYSQLARNSLPNPRAENVRAGGAARVSGLQQQRSGAGAQVFNEDLGEGSGSNPTGNGSSGDGSGNGESIKKGNAAGHLHSNTGQQSNVFGPANGNSVKNSINGNGSNGDGSGSNGNGSNGNGSNGNGSNGNGSGNAVAGAGASGGNGNGSNGNGSNGNVTSNSNAALEHNGQSALLQAPPLPQARPVAHHAVGHTAAAPQRDKGAGLRDAPRQQGGSGHLHCHYSAANADASTGNGSGGNGTNGNGHSAKDSNYNSNGNEKSAAAAPAPTARNSDEGRSSCEPSEPSRPPTLGHQFHGATGAAAAAADAAAAAAAGFMGPSAMHAAAMAAMHQNAWANAFMPTSYASQLAQLRQSGLLPWTNAARGPGQASGTAFEASPYAPFGPLFSPAAFGGAAAAGSSLAASGGMATASNIATALPTSLIQMQAANGQPPLPGAKHTAGALSAGGAQPVRLTGAAEALRSTSEGIAPSHLLSTGLLQGSSCPSSRTQQPPRMASPSASGHPGGSALPANRSSGSGFQPYKTSPPSPAGGKRPSTPLDAQLQLPSKKRHLSRDVSATGMPPQ